MTSRTKPYRLSRRPHCLGAAAQDDAPTPGAKKQSRRGEDLDSTSIMRSSSGCTRMVRNSAVQGRCLVSVYAN